MPHTITIARLCVAAAAASFGTAVYAAEEDLQLWTTFTLAGSPAENVAGTLELTYRERGGPAGADQVHTRANVDYSLGSSVSLGSGGAFVATGGDREWRPHQQVSIATGPLAWRTRFEQRFFTGADRMELRLRQRVQTRIGLAERTSLVAAGEVFGVLRSRDRAGSARIEQWRANLTLRHAISHRLEASAGYLLAFAPRAGREARLSHVPQIGLTLRP